MKHSTIFNASPKLLISLYVASYTLNNSQSVIIINMNRVLNIIA